MSITNWTTGEMFTARVYKRLTNRPDILWANTYELFAVSPNTDGALAGQQAAYSIASWESNFHSTDVQFDRVVFSTIIEDGQPYDPDAFVSAGLTDMIGKRAVGVDPQPLQVCLLARRVVSYGRNGRLLYRRVLTETDVTAPGGTPSLVPASRIALQAVLDGPWDTDAESPGIKALLRDVYGLDMVMVGDVEGTPHVRVIDSIEATGVVIKKYNNAFYNKSTPPAGPPINP